jgi:hypothetical protein
VFSNTLSLCPSFNVREQVSHPYHINTLCKQNGGLLNITESSTLIYHCTLKS